MPEADSGASALASPLDGSSAGELIPELARHGLQQVIELEVAAVLGADHHERSEERCGYRNGTRPRLLTTQVATCRCRSPNSAPAASSRRSSSPEGGSIRPFMR